MDDFLYDNPELYENVFPQRGKSELCVRIFDKHLMQPPASVLDIGCGTGRELFRLSRLYPDCVGVDISPHMVAFAKEKNPNLKIMIDDMRSCRLHRTFDIICALGGSINFALTNEELENTVKTYQVHSHKGTLLLLQPLNSSDFFGKFDVPEKFSVSYNNTKAVGLANYKLDKIQQVVERTRIWKMEDGSAEFADSMTFRIIFPAELSYFLDQQGFEVLEMFEDSGNAIYTKAMYIVARFRG